MKILITGINSKLGTLIARKLSENHEVIGLDLRSSGEFKTIKFDLGSNKALDIDTVDVCLHFAFITDPKYCEEKKEKAYNVNVLGTKKILDCCKNKKIKKFILISTGGVYGFNDKVLKEDMELQPSDAYSSMKYEAEQLAEGYSNYFDVVILRYFFPYGPETKQETLINRLINNIKSGKKIILHNNGKPVINPIFITDLVEATCLFCVDKFNGFNIFNVAGPENAPIKKIALIIGSILDKEAVFEPNNKVSKDMVASIDKLSMYYKPRIELRQGLKMTIDFLENNVVKK